MLDSCHPGRQQGAQRQGRIDVWTDVAKGGGREQAKSAEPNGPRTSISPSASTRRTTTTTTTTTTTRAAKPKQRVLVATASQDTICCYPLRTLDTLSVASLLERVRANTTSTRKRRVCSSSIKLTTNTHTGAVVPLVEAKRASRVPVVTLLRGKEKPRRSHPQHTF